MPSMNCSHQTCMNQTTNPSGLCWQHVAMTRLDGSPMNTPMKVIHLLPPMPVQVQTVEMDVTARYSSMDEAEDALYHKVDLEHTILRGPVPGEVYKMIAADIAKQCDPETSRRFRALYA